MYANADGCSVYYEQAGSGDPVLILHGWGTSSQAMKPLLFLAAKCRTARAIDFPGFGLSGMPPASWGTAEYAGLVEKLLDAWGVESTDIVAHSFGARVAIRLAAQSSARVKRMVLTGAAGVRLPRKAPLAKRLLGSAAKTVGAFGLPGKWLKEKIYSVIGSADYLAAGDMRPILVRVVNEDLSPLLGGIDHPTLLIWGADDNDTPVAQGRKMSEGMKNAQLEIVKNAGHYAFNDRPEEFNVMVKKFLEFPA